MCNKLLEDYVEHIQSMVYAQKTLEQCAKDVVQHAMSIAIATGLSHQLWEKSEDPVRKCSDLAVVAMFYQAVIWIMCANFAQVEHTIDAHDSLIHFLQPFLQSVCQQLKAHSACSDVKDTIDAKFTIIFTLGKQREKKRKLIYKYS